MESRPHVNQIEYAIIEVEKTSSRSASYPSNVVVINELAFYDVLSNKINYSTTEVDAYDVVSTDTINNIPYYWGYSYWGRNNLNDGNIYYSDQNCTAFLYNNVESNSNGTGWARFLVVFEQPVELSKVYIWTSSNNNRDIHIMRLFTPKNGIQYNKTEMLDSRDNSNLSLKWELVNDLSQTGDGIRFTKNL